MLQTKGQNESTISEDDLQNSYKAISIFLSNFSLAEIKKISWDLLIFALGSEDANGLSHHERSNMLFFYEQINKVCEALVIIDANYYLKHAP